MSSSSIASSPPGGFTPLVPFSCLSALAEANSPEAVWRALDVHHIVYPKDAGAMPLSSSPADPMKYWGTEEDAPSTECELGSSSPSEASPITLPLNVAGRIMEATPTLPEPPQTPHPEGYFSPPLSAHPVHLDDAGALPLPRSFVEPQRTTAGVQSPSTDLSSELSSSSEKSPSPRRAFPRIKILETNRDALMLTPAVLPTPSRKLFFYWSRRDNFTHQEDAKAMPLPRSPTDFLSRCKATVPPASFTVDGTGASSSSSEGSPSPRRAVQQLQTPEKSIEDLPTSSTELQTPSRKLRFSPPSGDDQRELQHVRRDRERYKLCMLVEGLRCQLVQAEVDRNQALRDKYEAMFERDQAVYDFEQVLQEWKRSLCVMDSVRASCEGGSVREIP